MTTLTDALNETAAAAQALADGLKLVAAATAGAAAVVVAADDPANAATPPPAGLPADIRALARPNGTIYHYGSTFTYPASMPRLTQEEIDGIDAALHTLLPGCNSLIALISMARESIRLREALLTARVNLENQPKEAVPEICTYITNHLNA